MYPLKTVYPLKSTTAPSARGVAFGVEPNPSFPAIEEHVLDYWRDDDTFRRSIEQRRDAPEWVFYDGPPFANGLPHYGHLLTGYAKDLFPRFQTMKGKRVERRFGWDTHGLPAELEAMKQLGLTEKHEIEDMGIEAFNAAARKSVLQYTREWREYVTRQARWVDFDNDYKSLDVTFMESVLWAFKQLYDKGLAYEGHRVLPYCWRDETPLSNHELRMDDDVYKMRQDQTVTVSFPLVGEQAVALGLDGVQAIAWTTTPWTLPTNEALAVGPDIEYVVVAAGEGAALSGRFLLAKERVGAYLSELGFESVADALATTQATFRGRDLEHLRYKPLFDYFTDIETYHTENAWQILVADYVSTSDGTGIVHQAPAYGEDDQVACQRYGIPVILSVDAGAKFLSTVPDFAGLQVFDANKPITQAVKQAGRLLQIKSYEHSYPHCWRCRTPLIYKAVSSWFVKVTAFKDRMVELNQTINWVPENVKDGQFGKWLENARDWSISRNRYWGSPIPVWKSDNPEYPRVDVYGSLAELERDFGRIPVGADGEPNLHRPYIDALTRPNPDDPTGKSTMRRIEDIFDVWFDSGSMPYAQVHYPFENADWFDTHNPADFVVEYIGQTRGWFYLLHVLATALFDRPAFKNVVSHGIVLGSDGQKMSKSLRNYPDVNEVFDRDGSDAMRWFLMSSPILRGGNLVVTESGIREGVRQFLLPLWSTWYFFSLYANSATQDGYTAHWSVDSDDVLDRYILAKTAELADTVSAHLEAFDASAATGDLRTFAEVLTNWYVRRSRDRFWEGTDTRAFDTLYTVLHTLVRVAAPLAPLITEDIWQGLTGADSVHLTDWPEVSEFPRDDALIRAMDRVRDVTSTAQALRKAQHLRVRLPLARLTVVAPHVDELTAFGDILADELNVRTVNFDELTESVAQQFGIKQVLTVNARQAGPRLGKQVQAVIKAAKVGDWRETSDGVTVGETPLNPEEYTLSLTVDDTVTTDAVQLLPGAGFVLLDTQVTPELAAEGLARDAVRLVQQARKDAGLDVSDRIVLTIQADASTLPALQANAELIASETLTLELNLEHTEHLDTGVQLGNDSPIAITVQKA